MSDDELRMTATHEAGHFVMSAIVGGMPRSVTIERGGDYLGKCGGGDTTPTPAGAMAYAMHCLAGGIACDYYGDYEDWLGSDGDIARALERLSKYYQLPEPALEYAEDMTRHILIDRRVGKAITEVADWLLATVTPSDEDIAAKYDAIARRVGFLRYKVYHWMIDGKVSEIIA